MERLRCVVERITYRNEQNGYSVIRCRAKGYNDLITAVGAMPDVHVGSVLALTGTWKLEAKYGRQFSIETFEETLPATVYGIEKYLGSGLVKGIGPMYARRIVQEFGADTLNVIEDNPDELIRVPGIGKVRVEKIKKSWAEQKEIKNIMLFLQGHDVSTAHATKIFKQYGADSVDVVRKARKHPRKAPLGTERLFQKRILYKLSRLVCKRNGLSRLPRAVIHSKIYIARTPMALER